MKPFIKWVGGKTRLLSEIGTRLPRYNTLIEPFVGGGALVLNQESKPAIVNDFNWQLMTVYHLVKTNPESVINSLVELSTDKDTYLRIRELAPIAPIEVATRFIYLNKVGFNGMWRENSYGKFNVPYGKGKAEKKIEELVSFDQIRSASERLQTVELVTGDFTNASSRAKEGDFVFFDPPYVDTWAAYNSEAFDAKSHKRLRKELDRLDSLNIKFMLTNSYNDVTKELYKGFNQEEIFVSYVLGGKNASREKRSEIMVTNYEGAN